MVAGCLLGLAVWLFLAALIVGLGWQGAVGLLGALFVLLSHWLAPDRPWE